MQPFQEVLHVADIWCKLAQLEANCQRAIASPEALTIPLKAVRDVEVASPKELGGRPSLSTLEGQARLLCDLASIELQAMEMGLRTLIEFPEAPAKFREELARVTLEEGSHLRLCLDGLITIGFPWGQWAVHTALWDCLSSEDSLLDRIVIVHRYLEGSGLDAGESIRRRMSGIKNATVSTIAARIAHDEIAHVKFGSDWYREICRQSGADPETDFSQRMNSLLPRLPKRTGPIAMGLRVQAGFSPSEIKELLRIQNVWRTR